MARNALTKTTLPTISSGGLNYTDMTFTTMTLGADNGVYFDFDAADLIVLNNTTGGAAEYTLILNPPASITNIGGSVTDPTVTVAAGKAHFIRPTDILRQTTDGDVYIDCDVAGEIAVINL